jgi:nucleoid-associated protein YgaU
MTRLRGFAALLGLAAIVIGMPALLIAAAPIGAVSMTWTLDGIWQALTTPDNGTIALALFKAIGWIAWAILTGAVLLELVAIVRRTPVPKLPGLAVPQLVARRLVATAAVLFIATSTASVGDLATAPVAQAAGVPQQPVPAHAMPAHPRPAEAHQKAERPRTYTVRKGDTLSEIALEQTGHARNYPKLFRASTHTVQPGGRHLTDPDEIDIGWKITIPAQQDKHPKPTNGRPTKTAETPRPTKVTTPAQERRPDTSDPQPSTPASTQAAPAPARPTPSATAESTEHVSATSDAPAWLLTGLAGAGALLAGAMWLVLARRREAQFRSRRPGRMIASPPAATIPVEKTLIREGSVTGSTVLFIDEVLRRTTAALTNAGQPVPVLMGVDAHADHLTVRLASPADLPPVWTCLDGEARQIWRIPADADLDQAGPLNPDGAPPWPQLVTLGRDKAGWRLVNLEAVGVASLVGDPANCADLARYLVSELAISPWARDVQIDCLAACPEMPDLAPDRVHYHDDPAVIPERVRTGVATADRLTSVHPTTLETARVTHPDEDLWHSRLLLSATTDAEHLDVLTRLVTDQKGRTGTAVVLISPDQPPTGVEIRLTDNGRVQVPVLGLDLVANGLTEDEARGCIALIDAGRNLEDIEMPVVDDPDGEEWEQFCNQAGAIRADKTIARDSDDAEATSVLPEPDRVYVTETANTAEDLAELAPKVSVGVAEQIEAADPTLDADLADWWADSCIRPRLRVLGPIKVRIGVGGSAKAATNRKPACNNAVTYLSTRPRGATTQETADALTITDDRVRQDMSIVRAWLGDNPRTGREFLPGATKHPLAIERGIGLYLIEDLLCDADLYKRLRLRGEARGPEGINDLRTALRLVNGTPYDGLRTRGTVWLADNPVDHDMLCSIIDVAHIVSTIAIHTGDLQGARAAAELAVLVAPTDANLQMDLAKIAERTGDEAKAAAILRSVITRSDSASDQVDLSRRNDAILRTHEWLDRSGRAS